MKTIALLIVLLLYPLKMPQGEDVDSLYDKLEDTLSTADDWVPCSQVFRIVKVETLDSIWTQKYPYDSHETITCDSMPEFHWEHYIRYSLCTTLVRDTVVFVGE